MSKIKQREKCALRVKNLAYKELGQLNEQEVTKVHTTLRKLNIFDPDNLYKWEFVDVIKLDKESSGYVKSSIDIIN